MIGPLTTVWALPILCVVAILRHTEKITSEGLAGKWIDISGGVGGGVNKGGGFL
jgi:hypothetical protein